MIWSCGFKKSGSRFSRIEVGEAGWDVKLSPENTVVPWVSMWVLVQVRPYCAGTDFLYPFSLIEVILINVLTILKDKQPLLLSIPLLSIINHPPVYSCISALSVLVPQLPPWLCFSGSDSFARGRICWCGDSMRSGKFCCRRGRFGRTPGRDRAVSWLHQLKGAKQ